MADSKQDPATDQETVFNPGQAEWVSKKAAKHLDQDQQALLLALAQLEAEIGRDLSKDEKSAIESLSGKLEGFDPQEIAKAIHQIVNQPADPKRTTSWAELKERRS